jgi:hypothetical protein
MPTVLQIISSLGVAAILAAIAYVIRLEKRMSALETIKVQVGEKELPKENAEQFWDKERGGGWRKIMVPVEFDEPFKTQPIVMVAVKRFDLEDFKPGSNIHRLSVGFENPGIKGFQLYFETWHESLVHKAVVSWIAVSR